MTASQIKQPPNAKSAKFPMFNSPESAALWFDIFNGFLLVGAFVVAIGTWGTIKTSSMKEKFADERIAANEVETKRSIADSDAAKEGTAKAHERIAELSKQGEELKANAAEANARAAEAQLALEKLKSPRTISVAQERDLITRMSAWSILPKSKQPQRVAVFSVSDTFESKQLADILAQVLGTDGAKWFVNRHPVMYGKSYSVVGIGLLIPPTSKRARAIAISLADALTEYGLLTFIMETSNLKAEGDEDENSSLSSISVMVGEKPSQ